MSVGGRDDKAIDPPGRRLRPTLDLPLGELDESRSRPYLSARQAEKILSAFANDGIRGGEVLRADPLISERSLQDALPYCDAAAEIKCEIPDHCRNRVCVYESKTSKCDLARRRINAAGKRSLNVGPDIKGECTRCPKLSLRTSILRVETLSSALLRERRRSAALRSR